METNVKEFANMSTKLANISDFGDDLIKKEFANMYTKLANIRFATSIFSSHKNDFRDFLIKNSSAAVLDKFDKSSLSTYHRSIESWLNFESDNKNNQNSYTVFLGFLVFIISIVLMIPWFVGLYFMFFK